MNLLFPPTDRFSVPGTEADGILHRLIGNLSGFVYRRRHDPSWTMEYLSAACRDLTGYDPHRFIDNASLTFSDLIAPADREHVDRQVGFAIARRQRAAVEYRLRTAYGDWVRVEDRLTPIIDEAGQVVAIEGVIDRARTRRAPMAAANLVCPLPA